MLDLIVDLIVETSGRGLNALVLDLKIMYVGQRRKLSHADL